MARVTPSDKNPKAIVEMQTVSRVYTHGKLTVKALDRVDLTIAEGDFAAVAGPSGSGKTTLLNLIGALDRPTSGRILLEGKALDRLSNRQIAHLRLHKIGFIFQSYNLIPVLSAYENAEFVLMLQGVPEATRRVRVTTLLQQVELDGMEDRLPDELSGGQQQRVAIARAIVPEPAIVLADEPTANVDSKTAQSLLDLMAKLNRERRVTFFFSTHDPAVMERARRLIRLKDGRIDHIEERNGTGP